MAFLMHLRHYAIYNIEPELLQDRRDILEEEHLKGEDPEWMYLQGQTLEAHTNVHHWCQVINEDLQCYDRTCQALIDIFRLNPPATHHGYGYGVACRVLARICKDKSKARDEYAREKRAS